MHSSEQESLLTTKMQELLMKISISKCGECKKNRLVDRVGDKWICFACKQKIGKVGLTKSIREFVSENN